MKQAFTYILHTGFISLIALMAIQTKAQAECHSLFGYDQAQNSLLVEFTDLSTSSHDIVSWLWHFGDGESSEQHNAHHTYSEPGTYEVCLTIHDNSDCSDTYCQIITVDSVAGDDCMALFGYVQLENTLTIHFIDSSSSSHDITSYLWNFGDGHIGDGHSPNHTYENPGTYEVCLTIHDNSDCNDTYCQIITVDSVAQGDCMALFGYFQSENTLTIHFIDSSSSSHDITSYLWNFGDGHNGDGHNPNHTYEHPGTYEVCLTIHDEHGCSDTWCHHITVNSTTLPCHAAYIVHIDSSGTVVHFTNTSTNTTIHTTYFWEFGDGNTSTDENPDHVYLHSGHYTACLFIQDTTTGCSSHFCHIIHVHHSGEMHHSDDQMAPQYFERNKAEGVMGNDHYISIYPNPFVSSTTIQYDLTLDAEVIIELNDLFGNRISQIFKEKESQGIHTHLVDAGDLYPGIYFIKVIINKEVFIKKITVSK